MSGLEREELLMIYKTYPSPFHFLFTILRSVLKITISDGKIGATRELLCWLGVVVARNCLAVLEVPNASPLVGLLLYLPSGGKSISAAAQVQKRKVLIMELLLLSFLLSSP